jgi:outer membrane protein assembly factor BamE (lipoprotein component of BamABCDE complex)
MNFKFLKYIWFNFLIFLQKAYVKIGKHASKFVYLLLAVLIYFSVLNSKELNTIDEKYETALKTRSDKLREISPIVYLTSNGHKYHRGYHYRNKNFEVNLFDAQEIYEACSVCNPPYYDYPDKPIKPKIPKSIFDNTFGLFISLSLFYIFLRFVLSSDDKKAELEEFNRGYVDVNNLPNELRKKPPLYLPSFIIPFSVIGVCFLYYSYINFRTQSKIEISNLEQFEINFNKLFIAPSVEEIENEEIENKEINENFKEDLDNTGLRISEKKPVKRLNNIDPELQKQINKEISQNFFSIGSTKEQVLNIQGTPSSISEYGNTTNWYYGSSRIEFVNNKVKEFSNTGKLKIKLNPQNTFDGTFFTIGSSKDEVLNIQGTPSSISEYGNTSNWYYGSSRIEFINNKVKEFSNNGKLKIKLNPQNTFDGTFFTIGSSKDEVLNIQGTPSSISEYGNTSNWYYGSSRIEFINNKVKEFSNTGKLKIKLNPQNKTDGSFFTIGSSKDEVLNIQGTPSSISEYGNTSNWYYGSSRIEFSKNMVKEYSNSSNNLKIKIN